MRVAARLAMHAGLPEQGRSAGPSAFPQLNQQIFGYHGCDVIVRDLSETGFTADIRGQVPEGAIVRLRLPGSGMMVARVVTSSTEMLKANFVNPVSASRLRMTLGLRVAA